MIHSHTYSMILVIFVVLHGLVTWICQYFICDRCRTLRQTTLTQSKAPGVLLVGPTFHTSIHCMDFSEISYVSLDLSSIHFACFNGS